MWSRCAANGPDLRAIGYLEGNEHRAWLFRIYAQSFLRSRRG